MVRQRPMVPPRNGRRSPHFVPSPSPSLTAAHKADGSHIPRSLRHLLHQRLHTGHTGHARQLHALEATHLRPTTMLPRLFSSHLCRCQPMCDESQLHGPMATDRLPFRRQRTYNNVQQRCHDETSSWKRGTHGSSIRHWPIPLSLFDAHHPANVSFYGIVV